MVMAMNPEIKARWTAALRSGEYPQAKAYLRTEDGYCCLGVLCDLAVKAGITVDTAPGQISPDGMENYAQVWEYGPDHEELQLPGVVMAWAGLSQHNPDLADYESLPEGAKAESLDENESRPIVPNLAQLNDNGTPFSVIADIIDAQL